MSKRLRLLAAGLATIAIAVAIVIPTTASSDTSTPQNQVIAHQLAIEQGKTKAKKWEARVSSGVMLTAAAAASADVPIGHGSSKKTLGCPAKTGGNPSNVRVNQDCSFRRQAEEVVAINPTNEDNLIAGQNDSVIGFNHCGYDFSFDGGKSWGSQVPPFYQFVLPDGHTADACSDPTATFDADGNAYIAGILFDVGADASAFVVAKSNAGVGGAFYHTPAPLSFQLYRTTPLGVVAADDDPCIFHDKEFIVADASQGSPKRNTVYATWTRFDLCTGEGVGANSPIYFSQSTDGGATWSAGIEISASSATLCTDFSGEANPKACDQDQGSHPVVGANGTLSVAFGNGNTPNAGQNQHLFVSCPGTSDCSNLANWTSPTKIGDDFGYQPFGPVASTACPAGRQCLPPNGYRMDDFVEGSISVDSSNKLYAVWGDGRNIGANCNPLGSAATATTPCDNDVFYAYSTDGGQTWSATTKLTSAGSAQWQPWSAVTSDGKKLYVAYYDRSYGNCESTGCNDITLATVSKAATATPSISYQRITTSSMPNLIVANNPIQAGFLGDYMWVAADSKGRAHIVWADTRGQDGSVEEDIYYARK